MQTVLKVACFAMLVLQTFAKEEPCGRRPLTHLPLILGGENSVPGEWPWHAAIFLLKHEKSTQTYRCGGTLISSSFVLTAAHCTFISAIPLPPNLLSMKLGVTNLNIGGAEQKGYGVKLVVRHSKYNPWNHHYDVALLKTFNKVKFSDFIQPVCLPSKNRPFERGTVVGWGIGETNQMETILQKADLNFVEFSTCLKSDPVLFSVLLAADHSNYCAGNRNATNACYGDSGGGMFTNKDGTWYITGITSAGICRIGLHPYETWSNIICLSWKNVEKTITIQAFLKATNRFFNNIHGLLYWSITSQASETSKRCVEAC
ncbi:chymotrypsinogen B-like isoform X2 [Aedes albopictus]|uniref:Peptidase S1 domain-containing protein n=1 Tax=Aedes albopictus TaxID=7160 RepID=A0ABM1Y8Y8_AEDAL